MPNSIMDKLDKSDTISEILLMLAKDKKTVCIVVEGEDDQKLFSSLFSKNVIIFQSYASKTGVDEIVKNYFPRNKRVIGIRDKDYLKSTISKKCFFCDYCCAEMMIIAIDNCFERVCRNFYKNTNHIKLRKKCLKYLEMISKLRLLNEQKHWKIKFDGIKVGKYYNDDITKMNNAIISEINKQNPQNSIDQIRYNMLINLPKYKRAKDLLNITNGHDFINLLCNLSDENNTSINIISYTLRGTFGKEEFKCTNLYKALLKYQTEKNLSIIV